MYLSLFMQCQRFSRALGYCSDCDDEWQGRFIYVAVSGHSGWVQYPALPGVWIMRFIHMGGKIQGRAFMPDENR